MEFVQYDVLNAEGRNPLSHEKVTLAPSLVSALFPTLPLTGANGSPQFTVPRTQTTIKQRIMCIPI